MRQYDYSLDAYSKTYSFLTSFGVIVSPAKVVELNTKSKDVFLNKIIELYDKDVRPYYMPISLDAIKAKVILNDKKIRDVYNEINILVSQ